MYLFGLFGLTGFGLPIILAYIGIFTLYILSFSHSPLKSFFDVFSKFFDKHSLITKTVYSITLWVVWLCYVDAYITLASHGLILLSIFLAVLLGISSIGLLEFIFKEWDFFKIATAAIMPGILLLLIHRLLTD